ncbi:hypothetical protein [Bradymonas sediminis]|uniref:Uncharacterized protein n=1 Tax=Bradymonas sediminis TaxID=1548548 RepID=A0A2Z4FIL1_9DELT|nr:hypothetical protein [Bradymonas sediminis]AWV88710.1 hypothetical protein DN745_04910 [Bradymonas sediminis]TDP63599.1 hypothetical protein DFR33_11056 [Bradymonas sediminis]
MPQPTQSNRLEYALAEARREGARAERLRGRRRLLITGLSCVALLFAVLISGWVLVGQAKNAAPGVISQMAAERRSAVELRLGQRVDEAGVLVGELFGFVELVWKENESMLRIQASVGSARAQLGQLDAEVRAAVSAPMTQMLPLLENGPTRARRLAEELVEVVREIRRLVPTVFHALGEAQRSFRESPEGVSIGAMIVSMDVLFEPFVGPNPMLTARWVELKGALRAWVARVDADFAFASAQMDGDALSDEFLSRLARRLF